MPPAQETLDRLMRLHGTRLLRLCAMLLQDAALAEDAVQDAFLRAFRRFSTFRGEAEALTWLTAIAVNVCRDYRRGGWFRHVDRRADAADLLQLSTEFPFPDNTVLREVTALPEPYREVVLLRYYQGMKQKDIARALRVSERTVRQRLTRANALLRERLKEWYEDEG